ncbi:MAG: transglycosylase SLT domain-containing protein [Bdellovibrionales bacterium]
MAKKKTKKQATKSHSWRMCPAGKHWVSTHSLRVPISEKNPSGMTVRDGHCRINRSKKDQIYSDEISEIASRFFKRVKKLPKPDKLNKSKGNDYDRLIAGWTKYWNEVLKSKQPLDPNLVKVLIRTESDFNEKAKVLANKGNWARGLMQVTDQTIEILKNEKGELKDFLINIDQQEAFDPNLNICAGVRWLFHKKYLLESRLKRVVSWEEAAMEYKSYTKELREGKANAIEQREKFLILYERLKK